MSGIKNMKHKGRIQKGCTAYDCLSMKLDKDCREIAKEVYNNLSKKYPDLVFRSKVPPSEIPGGIGACQPDGGVWYYKGMVIAAFECKKQQNKGNAIERWFKNNRILRYICSNISYVTFAIGAGAKSGGVIEKCLHIEHSEGRGLFNIYSPGKNSCFMRENGYEKQEIYDIMVNVLLERIENAR